VPRPHRRPLNGIAASWIELANDETLPNGSAHITKARVGAIAEFTKTTLIGGVLIIMPVYLSVLLLLKALAGVTAFWGLSSPRCDSGETIELDSRTGSARRQTFIPCRADRRQYAQASQMQKANAAARTPTHAGHL